MTSPVGSLSSVTFTDEMLLLRLKDFRFQRYQSGTQELIGPSCEMTASKLKYFNSGRKLRRCKCVAHIASPQTPQTRRPEKYRVYRSHMCLYVDFSWDSVARKNSFAFGVNAPLHTHTHTHTFPQTWLSNYPKCSGLLGSCRDLGSSPLFQLHSNSSSSVLTDSKGGCRSVVLPL